MLTTNFPFCRVAASSLAGSPGSDYPVGMLAPDILDLFLNVKVMKVNVDAVGGGGGGGGNLTGFVFTHRKIVDGCAGVQHVSDTSMGLWRANFKLDLSDVVRKPTTGGTSLYYPSMEATFFADGSILSSKTEAQEVGLIDFLTRYSIRLYANADMVVFGGGVSAVERYDELVFTPASAAAGSAVVFSGVTLTGTTSVRFGDTEATFTVDPTNPKRLTAIVPVGAGYGPVSFDQGEDKFSTRSFFKPA
jgi:hypothetical protein